MRAWPLVPVLLLAGCASLPEAGPSDAPLEVYTFWPGEGLMTPKDSPYPLGWMMRIHNPGTEPVVYTLDSSAMSKGRMGPVNETGWHQRSVDRDGRMEDTLDPGQARLWIMSGDWFCCHGIPIAVLVEGQVVYEQVLATRDGGGAAVVPGMHVQTRTVGVWVNGTSFYTNIPQMIEDPRFPAGFSRAEALAAARALPVYVYNEDRSEQPARSIDTCYFPTVPGYNALLKQQAVGVTGVRFLAPEEGYTRPGNEAHFLYGAPLIFLNTVVAIEERDEALDPVPDPQGDCFDVDRYTPDPVPDLPPTSVR